MAGGFHYLPSDHERSRASPANERGLSAASAAQQSCDDHLQWSVTLRGEGRTAELDLERMARFRAELMELIMARSAVPIEALLSRGKSSDCPRRSRL